MATPTLQGNDPENFTPFAKAVLDSFEDGVVVFNSSGKMVFASERARVTAESILEAQPHTAEALLPELAKMGGQLRLLRLNEVSVGEVVFLPPSASPSTLAQREREVIVKTLNDKRWKLTDVASELDISRTTLWRRLKKYGLRPRNKGDVNSV